MAENLFLAKSHPRETIMQHTDLLLDNLDTLRKHYPGLPVDWDMLRLMVEFHDLGKMNPQFQNKLYQKLKLPLLELEHPVGDEFPHGNVSVALLNLKELKKLYSKEDLTIIYQAIYYHHPRFMGPDRLEEFKDFLTANLQSHAETYPFPPPCYNPLPMASFTRYLSPRIDIKNNNNSAGNDHFYKFVLHKGLLHRLDYSASAHIPIEEPNRHLQSKTETYLQKLGGLDAKFNLLLC